MIALVIIVGVLGLVMGVMGFQILYVPAGIRREHRVAEGRIYSRTSAVVQAPLGEAVQLLQNDWTWWNKARAGEKTDLGDGRAQFAFHPIVFLNLIQSPPALVVRFDRIESLPDGGRRIHATLSGDFDGAAEYTARPDARGTFVELAWCGAEVRSVLKHAPIALVAAIHCWRERLGMQGLRKRLEWSALRTESTARTT